MPDFVILNHKCKERQPVKRLDWQCEIDKRTSEINNYIIFDVQEEIIHVLILIEQRFDTIATVITVRMLLYVLGQWTLFASIVAY